MKKLSYIVGGFLLGVIVTLSSGTVFAGIQSLVGQKVTGEKYVVVNGEKLENKGAVIKGVTNAPVRSLADSLGVDLKLEGDTIYITQQKESQATNSVMLDGKYYTKYDLLNEKKKLEDNLSVVKANLEKDEAKRSEMEGATGITKDIWLSGIDILNEKITSLSEELKKVNEALKAFE